MITTLAESAKVRSAWLRSPGPTAVDMSILSDANMAWMLAAAADVYLTGHERTLTFVELGSGEYLLAIERVLKVMSNRMSSSQMRLPVVVVDRLTCWVDGYVGSPGEPQLRATLAAIQAQGGDRR